MLRSSAYVLDASHERMHYTRNLSVCLPVRACRQSRVSMSAETGPVAHKPLFRVQVSHFLPGANAAFAFGDCPAFEADYAETQRRGPEYAEGIALRASRAERGWRMSGDIS